MSRIKSKANRQLKKRGNMRGNMASIKGKKAIYGDLEMTKTRFLNY